MSTPMEATNLAEKTIAFSTFSLRFQSVSLQMEIFYLACIVVHLWATVLAVPSFTPTSLSFLNSPEVNLTSPISLIHLSSPK